MDVEKLYTVELKRVLTLISKDLLDEYPSKNVTTEHFILSLLNNKQCFAYKTLNRMLPQNSMDNIYDFYAKHLHDNIPPVPQVKNEKTIYSLSFSKFLMKANDEKDKLNDPKISTEHAFLAILNDSRSSITSKFELVGITYSSFLTEISETRSSEEKKTEEDRSLAESISGFKPKSAKKNGLEAYCVNLNRLSQQGKIDDLIGRETEVNRIIKVIGRRTRNNIILVGLPGVGKTALIRGIANKIEKGEANFLNGKIILSLNITALIAGTTYRGDLEGRMNTIINELKANKDYILFIDDIHTVLGGNSNNSSEVAGILSNALSDGDIQLIATTSFKEYKGSIESNSTLNRRFQKLLIDPSSINETEQILMGSKYYYENYHNVKYSDDAIKACVYLANKYITERQLPDSAIDIMDECGSEKKAYSPQLDGLVSLRKEMDSAEAMRDKSYRVNDFKLGDEYQSKYKELKSKLIDSEKQVKTSGKTNIRDITETDIYATVSEMTGIQLSKLSMSEKLKYLNIESTLNKCVIGQEEAIKNISQNLKRNRIGFGRKNKPTGVFLFSGISGVGKTLLATKIAEEIYGSENSLVRLDMSEYSDKTSVNKLIGAGSGYIMAEQGGLLTESIKNNPYCVLLLDEIEKADKDVLNVFLQVFDNGVLSDNSGVKVSFKNTIIIMTSNIGAKDAASIGGGVGFKTDSESNKKSIINKAISNFFPPEFINRLDKIIQFNELKDEDLKIIISNELVNLNSRLNEVGYSVKFEDNVVDFIFGLLNNDKTTGARKINRIIQDEIENGISDLFLENDYDKEYIFNVSIDSEKKLKIN